jgi:hypothetical protein
MSKGSCKALRENYINNAIERALDILDKIDETWTAPASEKQDLESKVAV